MDYSVVYAVVDMSGSLELAADPAARTAMQRLTAPYYKAQPGGCEFACHIREGWEPLGMTLYQLARRNNISLRVDVLNDAVSKLMDTYLDSSNPFVASGQRTMGVYGFSVDAVLLHTPTNDANLAKASLATFPDAKRTDTHFDTSFATILKQIGVPGNGTAGNPKKTILLITDGANMDRTIKTLDGPISGKLCDSIKAQGFTLAVVEIKYKDSTGEYYFDKNIKSVYPLFSPGLQSCASPGYYFQAIDSDATSLASAFEAAAAKLSTRPLALSR